MNKLELGQKIRALRKERKQTLETLAEVGAQVFRTDQLGTFTIIWDTEGLHLPVEEAYNEPAAA